jgi:BirA family transcriptional regulator, biotin operon repressor / biotin---[acetyl-CoA-carboxylase] ligase
MNLTVLTYDILDSTNDEALKQAKLGAGEGLCVIARQQTAGRGRYGRTWVSERDAGLYLSLVLRPKLVMHDLPLITLMAGVALHDTLEEFGIKPDIKWVNDLLVNGKKIAGILAETTETPDGVAVVLGIGLNMRSANFPPELVTTATSLEDTSPARFSRGQLIEVLTRQIEENYEILQDAGGPPKIIERWSCRSSYTSGKTVRVVMENETIVGNTEGLEPNGALRIRRSDGTLKTIQTGEVEQIRPAN